MGNSPSRPNEYINNNHMGQSAHSMNSDDDSNNNGLDDPDDSRKKQINTKHNTIKKRKNSLETAVKPPKLSQQNRHQKSSSGSKASGSENEVEPFDFDMEIEIAKAFTNDSSHAGRRNSKVSNSSVGSLSNASDKKHAESLGATTPKNSLKATGLNPFSYASTSSESATTKASPPVIKNNRLMDQNIDFSKVADISQLKSSGVSQSTNETSDYRLNFSSLSDSLNSPSVANKQSGVSKKKDLTTKNKAAHDSLQQSIKHIPTPLASLAASSSVSSGSTSANNLLNDSKPKLRDTKINLIAQSNKLGKNSGKFLNIDECIGRLREIAEKNVYHKHFPFEKWEIQLICMKAREVFLSQPSLLKLKAPVKVVGDVHGQFNDLLRILKLSGDPSETGYLFLGDYVDRGKQSLETILLLLLFKIKFPQTFYMLRGNHESSQVTKIYGFYDECKRRCGTSKVWKYFVDCFNSFPFAGIINDKIFCVHGGISPYLQDMKQIEKILRPTDIPQDGLLTDLLWSDPEKNIIDWQPNSDRGVSCYFSKKNVSHFCKKFQFDLIVRGHMVVEDGYEFFGKKRLVTIFSAPNYCGEFNNWGAVMDVDKDLMCSFELLKPRRTDK